MVDRDAVLNYAQVLKAEYWEVSSKQNTNVKELFNRIGFVSWWLAMEKWSQAYSISQINEAAHKKKQHQQTGSDNNNSHVNNSNNNNNNGTIKQLHQNQPNAHQQQNGGCSC